MQDVEDQCNALLDAGMIATIVKLLNCTNNKQIRLIQIQSNEIVAVSVLDSDGTVRFRLPCCATNARLKQYSNNIDRYCT